MAKNQSIDHADSMLLSAYLDEQLSPEAQQALDLRLKREPTLRAELGDLRATVALLHELEPLRPPRSFALDPALVRPQRSLWQLPATWMRLGSAVATLLLALTITLRGNLAVPANSAAPIAGAAVPAPAIDAAAATNEPAAAAQVAPAALPAPAAANGEESDATASSATRKLPLATADANQPGALAANSGITDPQTSSPDTTSLSSYQTEPPEEVVPPARPGWLQIGLGALALFLLAGSFFVTRRM